MQDVATPSPSPVRPRGGPDEAVSTGKLITRSGSGITAYGLAGPNSGNFSVTIDGQTTMRSALSETTRYAHILFEVVGLDPKVNHSVTLTNMEDGKWFGFDYALVTTAVADAPSVSPSAP